jgi:hypothetical protein
MRARARILAASLAIAGCDRRAMPTPEVVAPPPVPSASEGPAPSASAASLTLAPPPGCSFVPLDGHAAFRSDLRWLATARDPGDGNGIPTFYAVELTGGAAAHALTGAFEGSPYQREWTPDGRTLVTFTNFHTGRAELELWDTATWKQRTTESIYCSYNVDISADGTWLGAVGCSGDHLVLDTRPDARGERWLRGVLRQAADVDIAAYQSPDSKSWLVADNDGQVEIFGVHPLRLRKVVIKPPQWGESMTAVGWSPDGRAFATAETNGHVRLWDASGALRKVVQKPQGAGGEHRTALAWGTDGLATAEIDGGVHLWDGATGAAAGTLGTPRVPGDPSEPPYAMVSFPGKKRLRLCAGPLGKEHLTVFEIPSGRALFERDGCGTTSPDGAWIWVDAGTHLEILDAGTGAVKSRVAWPPDALHVSWTADSRFVTWTEGKRRDAHWEGYLIRAARVADGASLWLALLDGPNGPRLVAQTEGEHTGDTASCTPGPRPAVGKTLQHRPGLIAEFLAAGG